MPLIALRNQKWLGAVILLVLIAYCALQVYIHWNSWLQLSVIWQKQLNQGLSYLLQETATRPFYAGGLLVIASFAYGFLHALGPGHGKLIITTYIATQATHLKQSVVISLLASLLQGLVAILLVSFVLILFQLSTKHLNQASAYAEQISYIFVILLGVFLCVSAIRRLWQISKPKKSAALTLRSIQPLNQSQPKIIYNKVQTELSSCACGHQHVVQSEQLQAGFKSKLLIILSMGIRPCSGAILVLLFSYVIDAYVWGIIAALMMAVGTALTICLIAVFVHLMRDNALRVSRLKGVQLSPYWVISLKIIAGVLFVLMGVLLYQSGAMEHATSPLLH
ncbi:TPA: nickel/cobalt transporter [Providencia rettgeri]|uniref:nickel/cobalt transporter n=1 Tax=Providencia sp. PROV129 TaxID=2949839 RepID=UPI00234ABFCC|nr:nickel/cobalt transporter [Providencia sp. PROV129]